MPTTEYFSVSVKDNKIKRISENPREFFTAGGKKEGKAKYIIEVFGYNHKKTAKRVRDMVDKSGMDKELFTIRVETR